MSFSSRFIASVPRNVAHAVGVQFQAVDDLGDLRDRDEVEFATKRDQGRATVRASLDGQLLGGRRSGGFR